MKIQDLGYQKYLEAEDKNTLPQKILPGKVIWTNQKIQITIEQTEERELEHWLIQNNNYQEFDPNTIEVKNPLPKKIVEYYIKTGQYDTLFKLLVNLTAQTELFFLGLASQATTTSWE